MRFLQITMHDWVFDVDVTTTMLHSAQNAADHCRCGYCRNFYDAVDTQYPNVRGFLAQFGLDLEAPDGLVPYNAGSDMWYDCCYVIHGRIMKSGKSGLVVDDQRIIPGMDNRCDVPSPNVKPYFFLTLDGIWLPWLLDEPVDGVQSPVERRSISEKIHPVRPNRFQCS